MHYRSVRTDITNLLLWSFVVEIKCKSEVILLAETDRKKRYSSFILTNGWRSVKGQYVLRMEM